MTKKPQKLPTGRLLQAFKMIALHEHSEEDSFARAAKLLYARGWVAKYLDDGTEKYLLTPRGKGYYGRVVQEEAKTVTLQDEIDYQKRKESGELSRADERRWHLELVIGNIEMPFDRLAELFARETGMELSKARQHLIWMKRQGMFGQLYLEELKKW